VNLTTANKVSVGPNVLQVNDGGGHFDFRQCILRRSGHNFAIDADAGAAVQVESVAVAAAHVAEEVSAATFGCGPTYLKYILQHSYFEK